MFDKSKKNPNRDTEKILKWIMNKRECVGRSDINSVSHPEVFEYLLHLPPNDDTNDIIFVLS